MNRIKDNFAILRYVKDTLKIRRDSSVLFGIFMGKQIDTLIDSLRDAGAKIIFNSSKPLEIHASSLII